VVAYLALLWAAGVVLLSGLRAQLAQRPDTHALGRAAVAAAFCALLVHTLAYAAYLEDPLTWTLLALGAALVLRPATAPADVRTVDQRAELAPLA
jgi:putative inorganic carbon (hco3(-)) transporter